jgi:hypothetical protein
MANERAGIKKKEASLGSTSFYTSIYYVANQKNFKIGGEK